jgi:uncharacterized membrane protein
VQAARLVSLSPTGVRIRQWPAQLASRALAALHLAATSGRAPTVEWHLRKVFTKLGISSRRQLRAALLDADPPSRVPRADPRKARWSTDAMTSETHGRLKRWFWRPPRPHGETIADRQVSVLELFYDLVYVAVIGQAAHHLAEHVTVRGLAEFAVVFALIWIAWINGSLYLEVHGREDGRTRSIVFVQMGILVLLAVFTADATDGSGWSFAVVYGAYQVLQTGLWSTVWRQDRRNHPEFAASTGGYVVGMGVSVAVILASALLPSTPRLLVWAGLGVAWIVGIVLAARSSGVGLGLTPTDSLVERFGLFTIIVLGEVVLGVVAGLSAAGAGMVSLIGHAHDATTPAGTSWLLAGAVATSLIALVLTEQALVDAERLALVFHPLRLALSAGAAAALLVGWLRPAPWLLALLLVAILAAVWFFAVSRFLRADAWGEP